MSDRSAPAVDRSGAPRVRPATRADLAALVALENASFDGDRLSPRQWRRHLAGSGACVLVAVDDAALLGAAVVFFRRGSRVARLYSMAVASAARGRGVGRALLGAAETEALRRGCRRMRLEVRADNEAALRLYERAGFACIARLESYYEDGADGWRCEKRLD